MTTYEAKNRLANINVHLGRVKYFIAKNEWIKVQDLEENVRMASFVASLCEYFSPEDIRYVTELWPRDVILTDKNKTLTD